jgi:hypothetical protein
MLLAFARRSLVVRSNSPVAGRPEKIRALNMMWVTKSKSNFYPIDRLETMFGPLDGVYRSQMTGTKPLQLHIADF